MSNLRINNITNKSGDGGTVVAGVSTVRSTGAFVVPVGPTEMRGGRGRGLFSGGYGNPESDQNIIQMIEIATQGNSTDFGDLTTERRGTGGACASSTRSVMIGGRDSPVNECVIDYVTFSSNGGASTFGELAGGVANSGQCSSATRGICYAGSRSNPSPANSSANSYITLASTGYATDFGDLTDNKVRFGVCSSSTRALYGGAGGSDTAKTNSITYVTIATTGNTEDFGDRTVGVNNVAATSNSIRGVFIGGLGSPTSENHIDYVTIATTGNAVDWGDSFYLLEHTSACSDSHGGIS